MIKYVVLLMIPPVVSVAAFLFLTREIKTFPEELTMNNDAASVRIELLEDGLKNANEQTAACRASNIYNKEAFEKYVGQNKAAMQRVDQWDRLVRNQQRTISEQLATIKKLEKELNEDI